MRKAVISIVFFITLLTDQRDLFLEQITTYKGGLTEKIIDIKQEQPDERGLCTVHEKGFPGIRQQAFLYKVIRRIFSLW